jgi:hypothetical protein
MQGRLNQALSGAGPVPATWAFAHWIEMQGGVVKPLTGAIVDGIPVQRCRAFRGFAHFTGPPGKVNLFNEFDTGDCILDLPGDADVPNQPDVQWSFARWVRLGAWTNITLSGLDQIIGYRTPNLYDRVLVLGQTVAAQNGLYVAQSGDWERDTETELAEGMPVYVLEGQGQGGYRVTSLDPLTLTFNASVDAQVFVGKPTGKKLDEAWDARIGNVRLVRSMALRRGT